MKTAVAFFGGILLGFVATVLLAEVLYRGNIAAVVMQIARMVRGVQRRWMKR